MKTFTAVLLTLTFALTLHAQNVPPVELSAGAAFVPVVTTSNSPNESYVVPEGARQGLYVSATFNLNDVVGIEGNLSRTSGRFVPDSHRNVYENQYLAGIRLSDRELKRDIVPYFSVLTGAIYRPQLLSYTGYSWWFEAGVGANFFVAKHFGFNVGAAYGHPFTGYQFNEGKFTAGVTIR